MRTPGRAEERSEVEVARINARQVILVTVITAVAGISGAVIQGVFASRKIDNLNTQLTNSNTQTEGLAKDLKESEAEREALYVLTANYLESDLSLTGSQAKLESARKLGVSDLEFAYRRLRRTLFFNLLVLRADPTIVGKTLDTLTGRGYKWIAPQKARVMADLPELMAVRLRWLEDLALPALAKAVELQSPAQQQQPAAGVPVPEAIQILAGPPVAPEEVTVTSRQALADEAALLKRSLLAVGK